MSLAINGTLKRGADVRSEHVMAATAVANIVKSSLGPVGLDKMLVDEVGDVTITNDGATILKQLEVEHPAARILVELSNLQDQEVGDGTTSVVIIAAELLKVCNALVKNHVHPTSIIAGLLLAKKEACNFIKKKLAIKVDTLGKDAIINCAKTSISSKIIGAEGDFFAKMAVDAVTAVKNINSKGKPYYAIKSINILKAHGKSARESHIVNGYALNCQRAAQGMPTKISGAKIALLDIDLRKYKMPLGVQILVKDPAKLAEVRKTEDDITKKRIQMLLKVTPRVLFDTPPSFLFFYLSVIIHLLCTTLRLLAPRLRVRRALERRTAYMYMRLNSCTSSSLHAT